MKDRIEPKDTFPATLLAIKEFANSLPFCGAEDMGGWPACGKPGTYGPSQQYLEEEEERRKGYNGKDYADYNTYCERHSKSNFRGREGKENSPLPFAGLIKWLEEYEMAENMKGITWQVLESPQAATRANGECYKLGHNSFDIRAKNGTMYLVCEDCKVVHGWKSSSDSGDGN